MPIQEVFNSPTVKQVIFQIVFPNYFGMENKVGDFQLRIMDRFPKSTLLYKQQFILTQSIVKPDKSSPSATIKIWQFSSELDDIILNLTTDALDISSTKHKTYNNNGVPQQDRFREIISFVVGRFLDIIPLTLINRMGLRYIDSNCPLPNPLNKQSFLDFYNTSINLNNLKIEDIGVVTNLKSEIDFHALNNVKVKYQEQLIRNNDNWEYGLDFDGTVSGLNPAIYLQKLDEIHEQILLSYENVIRDPVYQIMRA